jgi:hypothetical protein
MRRLSLAQQGDWFMMLTHNRVENVNARPDTAIVALPPFPARLDMNP